MIPNAIIAAASDGNLHTISAYFEDDSDGARDVDDVGLHGWTPLMSCAAGDEDHLSLGNVEVARYLLERGASVDLADSEENGLTSLLIACYTAEGTVTEMVKLLLSAGANPNTRNESGRTPLSAHVRFCYTPSVECVTALLRAGASLDRVFQEQAFEQQYRYPETPAAIKTLVAGVRRNGSFKRYVREPHREVLALRGLAMRGHIVPRGTRRTRGTGNWKAAVAFLARHGDNGVVWNVLSFWRATK